MLCGDPGNRRGSVGTAVCLSLPSPHPRYSNNSRYHLLHNMQLFLFVFYTPVEALIAAYSRYAREVDDSQPLRCDADGGTYTWNPKAES